MVHDAAPSWLGEEKFLRSFRRRFVDAV